MSTRTRRCEIRFTENEYSNLLKKAEAASLSVSAFLRHAVNRCEVKSTPPADLSGFIREIRRVGNNVNQILVIATARGMLDVPQLRKAISDLRDVEKLVVNAYV